jgi:hypothetical protein
MVFYILGCLKKHREMRCVIFFSLYKKNPDFGFTRINFFRLLACFLALKHARESAKILNLVAQPWAPKVLYKEFLSFFLAADDLVYRQTIARRIKKGASTAPFLFRRKLETNTRRLFQKVCSEPLPKPFVSKERLRTDRSYR